MLSFSDEIYSIKLQVRKLKDMSMKPGSSMLIVNKCSYAIFLSFLSRRSRDL